MGYKKYFRLGVVVSLFVFCFSSYVNAGSEVGMTDHGIIVPSEQDFMNGVDNLKKKYHSSRKYVICSNVKKNGKYLYKPRKLIVTDDGKKIGFIGISNVKSISEDGVHILTGDELDKAIEEDVASLKRGGADEIIIIGQDDTVSGDMLSENMISENLISINAVSENTVSENLVSENTVPENIVSENIVSENAVLENTVSENTVSESVVSKNAVSESAVSENTVSEDSVSMDTEKSDTLSADSISEQTASLYEVMKGDSLWKISYKIYGRQLKNRWEEIFNLNKNKIADQEVIYSGQKFELPN